MADATVTIDLDSLKAQVDSIPEEDLRKQLLDIRTKQKVQQKKSHNPEKQKEYQRKRNAAITVMTGRAKTLPASKPGFANLYEQILAEAAEEADRRLGENAAEETEPLES